MSTSNTDATRVKKNNSPRRYTILSYPEIYSQELLDYQCTLTDQHTISVESANHTDCYHNGRYIVKEASTVNKVDWSQTHNRPISEDVFHKIHQPLLSHLCKKQIIIFRGQTGPTHKQIRFQIFLENIWQYHFCKNLFHELPENNDKQNDRIPEFSIFCSPSYHHSNFQSLGFSSPTLILFHLKKKVALILATAYNGEINKALFTLISYQLGLHYKTLPFHGCACIQEKTQKTAIFFGLNSKEKHYLQSNQEHKIIGNNIQVWDSKGVWSLENGCYHKISDHCAQDDPFSHTMIKRNALLENVTLDHQNSFMIKVKNQRISYPSLNLINGSSDLLVPRPHKIIFIVYDAFGVLPPISRLSPQQAYYYFLLGYGAEMAYNKPSFSYCYSEPYQSLHPNFYCHTLAKLMAKQQASIYLINFGRRQFSHGDPGTMKQKCRRNILRGVLADEFEHKDYTDYSPLEISIPNHWQTPFSSYGKGFLHPAWKNWQKNTEYQAKVKILLGHFNDQLQKSKIKKYPG